MTPRHRDVAVIGSGVSGLVAAHVLARSARVTLYEADSRLGGHCHTHDVDLGDRTIAVDSGFIVHNDRTYPTLLRLFAELGIETQQTDMSMSVRADADGIEYAGGKGLPGLLPSPSTATRPRYLRMLAEVTRFHRDAQALLDSPADGVGPTVGEFVQAHGYSEDLRRWFLTPLVAAVWSCEPDDAERYPARSLFTFLRHHGMLGVLGSPAWRTVVGGSREYVDRVAAGVDRVRLSAPVAGVAEDDEGVSVTLESGETVRHDAVVIAAHAPQALAMLADPTPEQRDVLGAIRYSRNVARMHTDTSILPRNPRARASWNYLVPTPSVADPQGTSDQRPPHTTVPSVADPQGTSDQRPDLGGGVIVTYDLTRLQRLRTGDRRILVTLGGEDLIDPDTVITTMTYEHPLYTAESVAAQERLPQIGTDRIAFAGAYHGWGFHEDGALSGLRAAERLGGDWDAPASSSPFVAPRHPVLPRIYETTIRHSRRSPLRHVFTNRSYSWLVDLDHLPDHGVLARFEARDHIGDPDSSIRENIDAFLAEHGIDLDGGQVLMLTNARVAGYVFNPITVYWCYRPGRELACVVVEVHNTYGDRHAYLVHPDAAGDAEVDKALYVSPFNDTSGHYRLHVPEPGDEVHLSVRLEREGDAPFVVSLRGRSRPATLSTVRRIAWRQPLEPLMVSARIRQHGLWLWARGRSGRLPVRPRPEHPAQAGVLGLHGVDASRWPDVAEVPTGLRARAGARIVRGLIRSLARTLDLRIAEPAGTVLAGKEHRTDLPLLQINRHDDLARRVGAHGLIGFGEAYMAGDWEAEDLTAVLTVFARRVDRIVPQSWQRLRAAYVARHPHDEVGSVENAKSNISRHYDLSNELFASFLDESMAYSSALFTEVEADEAVLAEAQAAKFDRLLDEAHVGAGTRLLEIGTGWGELALRAARRGANVTTITLSTEQADLARHRVEEAGLSDRVEILVRDYRLVEGEYDAVVSVEMIEAVGLDYLPEYFATIDRVLAPGGRVAIQAITMPDHRMLATRDTYTWVHKYIFPGGLIPSLEAIDRAMAGTSLRVAEDLAMGDSYAQTLRLWDERFERAWPTLDLGLDETFARMWHFYLCYSRAGFEADYLDVHQLTLARVGSPAETTPSPASPVHEEATA